MPSATAAWNSQVLFGNSLPFAPHNTILYQQEINTVNSRAFTKAGILQRFHVRVYKAAGMTMSP